MAELRAFRVLWGQMGRPGFVTEVIEAWDAEDALVVAADLHPDLHRPRVAVPASEAWPPVPGGGPHRTRSASPSGPASSGS